jgi:hypothetical protein
VDVARRIAKKVECMVMDRENVTAKELTRYILAELKSGTGTGSSSTRRLRGGGLRRS